MNQSDYQLLIQACDEVLVAPGAGFIRKALPFLHVSNEHPINLNPYTSLFHETVGDRLVWLRRVAETLWYAARGLFAGNPWHASVQLPNSTDVLFVSHMVNKSHVGAEEDFYYGRLPEVLSERGFSCSVALIDHAGLSRTSRVLEWPAKMAPRILLSRVLRSFDELKFRLLGFRESLRLVIESRRAKSSFHKQLLRLAAQKAPSSASVDALRLSKQMSDLVTRLRPKAIVVTYEGNAWERLVFAAAREVSPQVRCIGYQHTVLFRRQHALLRSLGNGFDPDTILTSGLVTRDMVVRGHDIENLEVGVLGTHRRAPIGEPTRNVSEPTCLVIPDGIMSECVFLFGFALECAYRAPEVRFSLRLHPVVSFAEIADHDPRLHDLPDNFELSELSLSEDLARSRWAAYRGTSVAIYSVLAGLRPLYVSQQDEMSIDPLYELKDWRCVIQHPANLVDQVNEDLSTEQGELQKESKDAVDYCSKYFVPQDPLALEAVIC